jgi:hypothetical protein
MHRLSPAGLLNLLFRDKTTSLHRDIRFFTVLWKQTACFNDLDKNLPHWPKMALPPDQSLVLY